MKRSRTKFFICSGLVAFLLLGQGCGDSGQLLHFGDFFCIFALSFIKNGKWEINH